MALVGLEWQLGMGCCVAPAVLIVLPAAVPAAWLRSAAFRRPRPRPKGNLGRVFHWHKALVAELVCRRPILLKWPFDRFLLRYQLKLSKSLVEDLSPCWMNRKYDNGYFGKMLNGRYSHCSGAVHIMQDMQLIL